MKTQYPTHQENSEIKLSTPQFNKLGQCPNTIKSYRDTFKLLLLYCKQNCNLPIEQLCLKQLDKTLIIGFLNWLEKVRNNSVSTRNQRLACIHGFYQFVQLEEPVGLLLYQQILSIPIKKTQTQTINATILCTNH